MCFDDGFLMERSPEDRCLVRTLWKLWLAGLAKYNSELEGGPSLRMLCKRKRTSASSTTIHALAPVLLPSASPGVSALPNLTTLRLYIPHWVPSPMRLALMEQLFAGLTGSGRLKRKEAPKVAHPPRILAPLSDTDSVLYAVLDEALCALELLLGLEVDTASYAFISPFFPRLKASGAVSRTEGGCIGDSPRADTRKNRIEFGTCAWPLDAAATWTIRFNAIRSRVPA
ncbi:hypothetical protein B0H14DRAFT_2655237 [Mycena olivaceomarginata]|nr:hypothetical protein B0H14DRAFT_2655237 [Mycena olivaceomarginata]